MRWGTDCCSSQRIDEPLPFPSQFHYEFWNWLSSSWFFPVIKNKTNLENKLKKVVRVTYNWYDVVKAWQLLLKEVYLVEFRIPLFLKVHNCVCWRFDESFIVLSDIIRSHARCLLTLFNCAHNIGFAIKRINFYFLIRVEEFQIMDVLVGRRYFLFFSNMLVHVPACFWLRHYVSLVGEIEAEIIFVHMRWHFEIAFQAIINGILLRKHTNATYGHLSNCQFILRVLRYMVADAAFLLLVHRALLQTHIAKTWTLFRC